MSNHGQANVESLFKKTGAVLDGHFLLTSRLHSPVYWEKFRILEHPKYTQQLCAMIAERFKPENIDVVAGPTTGGIILAFEVAKQLGVRCIFAEKEESGKRAFRRGFLLKPGERVLVVDDVLTTGKSVKEVLEAVAEKNASVVGIGVLVDRSEHDLKLGYPLFSCLRSVTPAYKPEECPLCKAGKPLVKPGSSHKAAD
ncbi:MAG: orotate phosphoribosyltransferase [Dehalococcoidia bacterium]|nr:MAG: orotate phosphoribosyltransferase [Dehalococcoidia bacterium]